MLGLMQHHELNLAQILEHAARFHGDGQIVSRTVDGRTHRFGYRETLVRTKRLANSLLGLGIGADDRVATLAWNTHRHLEAWYAVAGIGAICHTVNPRLHPEQIVQIINHGGARLLLVDTSFLTLLEGIQDRLESIETIIILCEADEVPEHGLRRALCYETVLAAASPHYAWPSLPEDQAAALCYTSGTTGDPKGVLYSHRSNILMAYAMNGADAFGLSSMSSVLVAVPMFHANAWGLVYAIPMVGARMVLPGPHLGGESLQQLILEEEVTQSAAVPTVWNNLLNQLTRTGGGLGSMEEVLIGGAAVPRSMVETFQRQYGVSVLHAWGMTELNPLGTINRPVLATRHLGREERLDLACKQGRPVFGVEMCLKGPDGRQQPHDGTSAGRLLVRGPWVAKAYFHRDDAILDADGWFDTGDIATIDRYGYMQIVDRAKDLIKSGGEWISSIDLENAAMGFPGVEIAAVIGVAHHQWSERPLLLVKPTDADHPPDTVALLAHLKGKVATWWLPDAVEFVETVPLAATGKINKALLREIWRDRYV